MSAFSGVGGRECQSRDCPVGTSSTGPGTPAACCHPHPQHTETNPHPAPKPGIGTEHDSCGAQPTHNQITSRHAAEIVIAETGGDMAQFASWIGVCPGQNDRPV